MSYRRLLAARAMALRRLLRLELRSSCGPRLAPPRYGREPMPHQQALPVMQRPWRDGAVQALDRQLTPPLSGGGGGGAWE